MITCSMRINKENVSVPHRIYKDGEMLLGFSIEFEEDRNVLKEDHDFPQWLIDEVFEQAKLKNMTLTEEEKDQIIIILKAIKDH